MTQAKALDRRSLLAAAGAIGVASLVKVEEAAAAPLVSVVVPQNTTLQLERGYQDVSGAPVTVRQGGHLYGRAAGTPGVGTTLRPASGFLGHGIEVKAANGDLNACHWWHVESLNVFGFSGDGLRVYGPNEDALIADVNAYGNGGDGIHVFNRMAGFKGLERVTAHGNKGWGVNFENVTSTVRIASLSGDRNVKGLLRLSGLNWAEFLIEGLKHEYDTATAQAGQPPITIDCGAGRNVYVDIHGAHIMGYAVAPPRAAIKIVSGNVFLRVSGRIGYFQNWLEDVPRGVLKPLAPTPPDGVFVYNTAT